MEKADNIWSFQIAALLPGYASQINIPKFKPPERLKMVSLKVPWNFSKSGPGNSKIRSELKVE